MTQLAFAENPATPGPWAKGIILVPGRTQDFAGQLSAICDFVRSQPKDRRLLDCTGSSKELFRMGSIEPLVRNNPMLLIKLSRSGYSHSDHILRHLANKSLVLAMLHARPNEQDSLMRFEKEYGGSSDDVIAHLLPAGL